MLEKAVIIYNPELKKYFTGKTCQDNKYDTWSFEFKNAKLYEHEQDFFEKYYNEEMDGLGLSQCLGDIKFFEVKTIFIPKKK